MYIVLYVYIAYCTYIPDVLFIWCNALYKLIGGIAIVVAKITAAQNEDTLSYHRVLGLYFLVLIFVRSI